MKRYKELYSEAKKESKDDLILSIAKKVYDATVDEETGLGIKARCLEISQELQKELKKNKIDSKVVQGKFEVDEPDEDNYTEWDVDDFNSEEEMEEAKHNPLHYWVEVNGKILDIAGSQFKDEVIYDDVEDIVFAPYSQEPRYKKTGYWK